MLPSESGSDPSSSDRRPSPDTERAQLAAALDALELLVLDDIDAAEVQGQALQERTLTLGLTDLTQRARLVLADAFGRRGETALAAAIERDVLAWATEQGDDHVIARAQRLQATFYTRIGDAGAALECAVIAVERLKPDVPRRLVADHLMCLALAYCGVQAYDAGRERLIEVIAAAVDLHDHELHVRALNNLAFLEYLAGFPEQSLRLAEQLATLADTTGIQLNVAALETVARAQMSMGAYAEAVATLSLALESTDRITESDDTAAVHLTSAECHRIMGNFDLAEKSLRLALEQCDERELEGLRPQVIEEQSALAAARGDYQQAYELYREFHRLEGQQLSEERESRARILAAVLETDQAVSSSERYREMSLRDPLTGLYNRRYVDESLPRLLLQASAFSSALSIAIADLDHFKRINDLYSHGVGDSVLRQFAVLLETACPPAGFVARLGGEEFLLVLPGYPISQAETACETFLSAVRQHGWKPLVGDLPVTVSIGVVSAPAEAVAMSALLSEADRMLYEAKRGGRDRVVAGTSGTPQIYGQRPSAMDRQGRVPLGDQGAK
jgi:diguanylate cyclase (GGDEF)-like protein